MLTSEERAARDALRARQGAGARYDAASAPHDDLLLVRRGTANFARKLNRLPDGTLYDPSLEAGWTRAHFVANVCYQARALTRLAEWARTGIEQAMYSSADARDAEIALGATLPAHALRNLFLHSSVHLDVEWRDLEDTAWDRTVRLLDGSEVPVRSTPKLHFDTISEAVIQISGKI